MNDVHQFIQTNGIVVTYGLIFLWGLAMNLTPCVYPMIPITISYFGGMAEGGTRRSSVMAALFVVGMAITYSALGVSAALTGRLFGSTLGNPWIVGFVTAVLLYFALSTMGVFRVAASSDTLTAISNIRDKMGYLGALFFGLTVGLVMAPCVGPAIVGLLTYVASTRDPLQGFYMFFTLALGMGLPYLILGTFTGMIKSLPRPGVWMLWLEHVFGFILIGMAVNLWVPFMPQRLGSVAVPAYAFLASMYLGFLDKSKAVPLFRAALALLVMAVSGWLAFASLTEVKAAGDPWIVVKGKGTALQQSTEQALQQARQKHQPVMMDFYATWCAACNELDEKTYPDAAVKQAAARFVRLKIDLSLVDPDELESNEIIQRFHIKGMPTVLFFNSDGTEMPGLRIEGFAGPEQMRSALDKVP